METNQNGTGEDDNSNETSTAGDANNNSEETDGLPKLFVGRLPMGTKEDELKDLFQKFGEVSRCDVVGKYGFVVS